jgi:diketogulonate reductase-like aldo/keto reductase
MVRSRGTVLFPFLLYSSTTTALSPQASRRNVLQAATASATAGVLGLGPVGAVASAAAAAAEGNSGAEGANLVLTGGISIPRVGYSLYKTPADQVPDGVALALKAGIRHFDCASQYGTNEIVGKTLTDYVQTGIINGQPVAAVGSTKQSRRQELFFTQKLSYSEQSIDKRVVLRNVDTQRKLLGVDKLDMVMVHSPLSGSNRRLETYEALLNMQLKGSVRAVGVCHYGVRALNEIVSAGLPAPAVIQLVLSPFNQHKDVAKWAATHGSVLSCAAWSKLSSVEGPVEGWAAVGKIADARGMTKQQVLVRWAVQCGYLCVPRSGSKAKTDQQAIAENSWQGTASYVLSDEDMATLNNLDTKIPAGQLGVLDGWEPSDIVDAKWDPTLL